MRKLLLALCACVAAVGVFAGSAFAFESAASVSFPSLTCSGTLLVDVSARILNEADGGILRNVWALDAFNERARVWQTSPPSAPGTPGHYCVVQNYSGSFVSFAGRSPENTGWITAGVTGSLVSVQRFELAATFHPIVPTSGFLGIFDLQCDYRGVCPGDIRFSTLFFQQITGFSGSALASVYFGGEHGTWIQTSLGDLGDITG